MNVESHDPRLDLDGLRLHPLVIQTEGTSDRSTITISRRPLNIESKISPNSSTVTRNSSALENPATAENFDFDDSPAPDLENVKYCMIPHQRNNSNTCVGMKPFGGDYPSTSLASNPQVLHNRRRAYAASLGRESSRLTSSPRNSPPLSLANTEHTIWL
jgi:hypothetical protein